MADDQIQPDEDRPRRPAKPRRGEDEYQEEPAPRRRARADRDEEEYEEKPRRRRRDDEDEEDDRDVRRRIRREEGDATGGIIPYKNVMALMSYYCGVFSIVCGLLAPVALVLGILGLRYKANHPTAGGTAHAIVGIVLGGLVLLGYIGVVVLGMIGAFS